MPVLAYPRTARDSVRLLRPAGGIFTGTGPTLQLTWKDGALACVLARLLSVGRDCSLFNAQRLSGYFGRAEDPWDLDLDGIAEKIAAGDFSAYDIDALPTLEMSVNPGPGEWFLESPLRPVPVPDAEGRLTGQVSEGVHALFSVEGRLLKVAVDRTGTLVSVVR